MEYQEITQEIEVENPLDLEVKNPIENERTTIEQRENEKMFTQEEVNKIVQDRLNKEKVKQGKERDKLLNEADFSADLIKRDKEITRKEKKFAIALELQSDGLPLELANYVNYTSDKSIESTYAGLKSLFTDKLQKKVEESVQERLKGSSPTKGIVTKNTIDTKIKEIFK